MDVNGIVGQVLPVDVLLRFWDGAAAGVLGTTVPPSYGSVVEIVTDEGYTALPVVLAVIATITLIFWAWRKVVNKFRGSV